MKKFVLAFLLTLPLLAIAKKPPNLLGDVESLAVDGSKEPGRATLVLMRGSSRIGLMHGVKIFVDDKEVGVLRRMNYITVNVEPGTHSFKFDCSIVCDLPDFHLSGTFAADRTYYFIEDVGTIEKKGRVYPAIGVYQLSKDAALAEMPGYIPGKATAP